MTRECLACAAGPCDGSSMISTFISARHNRLTAVLVLLLSLSLVLRLLGPWVTVPVKEGYALICTGGEIVQIPLSELGLAPLDLGDRGDPEPERHAEPCIWFGQSVALPGALAALAIAPVVFTVFRPLTADRFGHGRKAFLPFHVRAPPALPG